MRTLVFRVHSHAILYFLVMALTSIGSLPANAQVKDAQARIPGASSPVDPVKVSANGRYLVDKNDTPFPDRWR